MVSLCYAAVVSNSGWNSLGNRNRWDDYVRHLPDLVNTADLLLSLCCSAPRASLVAFGKSTERRASRKLETPLRYEKAIRPTDIMSVLVGRRKLLLKHDPVRHKERTVRYRTNEFGMRVRVVDLGDAVVPVEFWIQEIVVLDRGTGEILESSALQYSLACSDQGYRTAFYRITPVSVACIVAVGRAMPFPEAIQQARSIAKEVPGVDFSLSSFVREVPAPLSLAHDDSLCQFLEWDPVLGMVNSAIENSNSILESLLDHGADEPMPEVAVGFPSESPGNELPV